MTFLCVSLRADDVTDISREKIHLNSQGTRTDPEFWDRIDLEPSAHFSIMVIFLEYNIG